MQSWKTISRSLILDHSKFLSVEDHTVELPDGRQIPNWPWIITRHYVNVMAHTPDGKYLCFRQTKYGLEGDSLAAVGGYLEPGEDPLIAAQRELLEETGYQSNQWTALGHYQVDGGHGCGEAFFFLALDVEKTGEMLADDLEEQQLLLMDREEILSALCAGEFKILPWAAIMALGLLVTQ